MDNIKNIQSYRKITTTIMILIMGGIMVLTPSISIVNAAPKDPAWGGSSCTSEYDGGKDVILKTCCWREIPPGKLLGETYCQTCHQDGTNCGDKELQMDLTKTPESARPSNNDGVAEDPATQEPSFKSDKGIFVEEEITEKELQQAQSSEDKEGKEPVSRESLSNSENLESTLADQQGDD
jgi:hypothetical protein